MKIKPYYEESGIAIYHGDCLKILPHLPKVDLVLTDPPYGINIGKSGSIGGSRPKIYIKDYGVSTWDQVPLSSDQWTKIKSKTELWIIWGGNHLAGVLGPSAGMLVWDKKCQDGWDDTFSECEVAWTNIFTRAKMFRHLWAGAFRASERGGAVRKHPTQKPVALMTWCISIVPNNTVKVILDPFTGSGTTLVAAKQLGFHAIGIEIEEKYCRVAAKRLRRTVKPLVSLTEVQAMKHSQRGLI